MAVVEYADAIKTVSGALTKINKKSPHAKDQKMVLATHRKAASSNPNCTRLYLRGLQSITRSTDPSAKELLIRARFNAVSKAVALRRKDLMQINQDNAAFLAQRDTAGGCKTLTKYLWKVCGDEYDEQHGA